MHLPMVTVNDNERVMLPRLGRSAGVAAVLLQRLVQPLHSSSHVRQQRLLQTSGHTYNWQRHLKKSSSKILWACSKHRACLSSSLSPCRPRVITCAACSQRALQKPLWRWRLTPPGTGLWRVRCLRLLVANLP